MKAMWGKKYLVLAVIGFGLLGAVLNVRGNSVYLFEAVVVILVMTISIVGETWSQGRNRDHPR
jgi:hypothetical protein